MKDLERLERLYMAGNMELDYVMNGQQKEDYEILEKDLQMLDIFQGALTIERHEPIMVEHNHSNDAVELFIKQTYKIKENQIEKDICQKLREWVLKNAFPKELKALEIIKKKKVNVFWLFNSKDVDEYNSAFYQEWRYLTQKEYDLLKEVLL